MPSLYLGGVLSKNLFPQSLKTTDSPTFAGLNLSGLTASKVVVTDGSKNLASGTNTDAQISAAVTASHAAVTVSAPISLSGQALSLVNNAGSPGTITAFDIGALATTSDLVVPTSKAIATYAGTAVAQTHARSHALDSTSDHSIGSLTNTYLVKNDGSKLVSATNTDAQVSAAVTASHAAVTLGTNLSANLLSLSTQLLDLNTQTTNLIFAGPTSGAAAAPTFRSMVAADLGTTLVPTFAGSILNIDSGANVLSIVDTPSTGGSTCSSQLKITKVATSEMLSLCTYSANNAAIMLGAELVHGVFTARATDAGIIWKHASKIDLMYDSGLTVGNTFTPTSRCYIDATGLVMTAMNVTNAGNAVLTMKTTAAPFLAYIEMGYPSIATDKGQLRFDTNTADFIFENYYAVTATQGRFIFKQNIGGASTDVLYITQGNVGIGTNTAPSELVHLNEVKTITGGVTDGYSAALRLDPGYTAATAQTVTRHNYIDVQDVSNAGAGPSAVTDSCVMRFDANAGTHKALSAAVAGVSGFIKMNLNGTLGYVPVLPATETANLVFAGPSSGAAAAPAFRALVQADLPADVAAPWRIDINVFPSVGGQTNFTGIVYHAILCGGWRESTGAQNAEVWWPIVLSAGTWTFSLLHSKNLDRGIYTVTFDATTVGTIDGYNATQQDNQITDIQNISVAASGEVILKLKMATKNASNTSGNYYGVIQAIALIRTA